MRPPSSRLRKNSIVLYHRTSPTPGVRSTGSAYVETATLPCTAQPLGDTGRRQDARDEHLRQGSEDSWRVFVTAADADAAGLVAPWAKVDDKVRWNGRDYTLRGEPIPQRFADDGAVLSWSLDIDGVA